MRWIKILYPFRRYPPLPRLPQGRRSCTRPSCQFLIHAPPHSPYPPPIALIGNSGAHRGSEEGGGVRAGCAAVARSGGNQSSPSPGHEPVQPVSDLSRGRAIRTAYRCRGKRTDGRETTRAVQTIIKGAGFRVRFPSNQRGKAETCVWWSSAKTINARHTGGPAQVHSGKDGECKQPDARPSLPS